MKQLLLICAVVALVGCGESAEEKAAKFGTRLKGLEQEKAKAATEAKAEPSTHQGRKLSQEEEKLVGEYELELKKFGETQRYVLLDNSKVEYYLNGKKEEAEHKWSKVDKEVHIERENKAVSVFSINKDESITGIATMDEDGKRTEIPKERQTTLTKIK